MTAAPEEGTTMAHPRSGEVLRITRRASVQFLNPFMFRVIRVQDWGPLWDGWAWLDGYQLDPAGDAAERRSIYVKLRGLQRSVPLRNSPRSSRHAQGPPRVQPGRA